MRPPLDGNVLITGASSGIGTELARQLAPSARALVLVARRAERLEALAQELRARHPGCRVRPEPCDLLDRAALDAMLERVLAELGSLDVLVNNAGFGDVNLFERSNWPKLQRMIDLNVSALTYLTYRLVGPMVERGRGGILNLSSGAGLVATPGVAVYVGTKHYVTGLSESLRAEVGPRGVVVTQVCPGPVATEFEAVAENPLDIHAPGLLEIPAEQCAREALAAFRAGRALVTPGFVARVFIGLGRVMPRAIYRLFLPPLGGYMRRQLDA